MSNQSVADLLADQRANAVLGWLLIAFLGLVTAESALTGDSQWGVFVAGVMGLCLVVPVSFRDQRVMLPWEVIALAALPTFGRAVATFGLAREFTLYLSVAALALVVAVELDLFTTVRMTVGFAVTLVVFATLATAGLWALVRWALDLTLGTNTLLVDGVSDDTIHDELMVEFLYSAVAGLCAGAIFEGYFRRRQRPERLPEEVTKP